MLEGEGGFRVGCIENMVFEQRFKGVERMDL